jgi:hypothetical protein
MTMRIMKLRLLLFISGCMILSCGKPADTVNLDAPRKTARSPHRSDPVASSHQRFGFNQAESFFQPRDPIPATAGGLSWKIPDGWEMITPTSMRNPNFRITADPDIDCYVTRLSGSGGGLAGNINRWNKQMGYPALETNELADLEIIETAAGPARLVEISGEFSGMGGPGEKGYRMLGALIFENNLSLTVKMVGPGGSVLLQKGAFRKFVTSIRTDQQKHDPGSTATRPPGIHDDQAHDNTELTWTAPVHWKSQGAQGIRLASFSCGDDESVAVGMFRMVGDAGGMEANINRWRLQMALEPADKGTIDALEKINVLEHESTLIHVRGTFSDSMRNIQQQENYGLLGLVCPLENDTLFIKMTGPGDEVDREREHFLRFCASLNYKTTPGN